MTAPNDDAIEATPAIRFARSGTVATLTFDRPASLNVLDIPMMDALVRHTADAAADDTLRVLVVRGAGPHFMAGGDLRSFAEFLSRTPGGAAEVFERIVLRVQTAIENLHRMPQITIAAVQGAVAGFGLSLVSACDLVVAADNAVFASAYRNIGTTPDGGATWSLPRLVGLRRALEICLLGERFGAEDACRTGLVNRVVAVGDLDATVADLAGRIASGPQTALRNVKRLLRDSFEHSLAEQLAAEAKSFAACAATPDFVEGIDAFLSKRPARFAP